MERLTISLRISRPSNGCTKQTSKICLSSNFWGGLDSLKRLNIRRPSVPNWSLMICEVVAFVSSFFTVPQSMHHSSITTGGWSPPCRAPPDTTGTAAAAPTGPRRRLPGPAAAEAGAMSASRSAMGAGAKDTGAGPVTERRLSRPSLCAASSDSLSSNWACSRFGSRPAFLKPRSSIRFSICGNLRKSASTPLPLSFGRTAVSRAVITCAAWESIRSSMSLQIKPLNTARSSTARL
mmetsp:Transcript_24272/g.61860  ORF Transcript_24272/g.61860 Transcript_24272/m.61860 type:complete len:236 (-) Transcript_24272:899-1606(-)